MPQGLSEYRLKTDRRVKSAKLCTMHEGHICDPNLLSFYAQIRNELGAMQLLSTDWDAKSMMGNEWLTGSGFDLLTQ